MSEARRGASSSPLNTFSPMASSVWNAYEGEGNSLGGRIQELTAYLCTPRIRATGGKRFV